MRQSYLCRIRRCLNCGGNDSARSAVACKILPVAEMAEPGRRNKPVTRSRTDRSLSISGEREDHGRGVTRTALGVLQSRTRAASAVRGDFFERNKAKLCSPINMAPRPLAKPSVSLSRGDEVPRIFIRESHQRARKILISFCPVSTLSETTPVKLPPGRLRLATNPASTGPRFSKGWPETRKFLPVSTRSY